MERLWRRRRAAREALVATVVGFALAVALPVRAQGSSGSPAQAQGQGAQGSPPAEEPSPAARDPQEPEPGRQGPPAPASGGEVTEERAPLGPPLRPPEAARAEPAARTPAPSLPAFEPAYRPYREAIDLLDAMARAAGDAARVLELPGAAGEPTLEAIEFGRPGGLPFEARPTVLLVGGLDGRSLSGTEAVLAIVGRLLEAPARLPDGVAFVAVPWGAPTALSRALGGAPPAGERAVDEDGDGRLDEDPPDDIDGNGLVLDMLVEDPLGAWTISRDERLLAPAGPGDGPRYALVPEGRDDDGDGHFNEDAPGGVVPDRNFPLGRDNVWRDPRSGSVPLSSPEARALAELALSRRTAIVVLLQGNHGGLAMPGGAAGPGGVELPLAADRGLYQRAADTFAAVTGRDKPGLRSLREARGEEVPGAALDWFYAGLGAFALEIAPWGPAVEGGADVIARDARYQNGTPRRRELGSRPLPPERDRAWTVWLDNTRGGLGFVDWYPVDLGGGRQGLVGGWEPFTILNPPLESLPRALTGLPEFVHGLALGLPRLEIRLTRSGGHEGVLHLWASVRNLGLLPTGLAGGVGPGGAGALTLRLELPPGARLVSGEPSYALGRLEGGKLTEPVGWQLVVPEGATLRLRAEAELALPVELEVRP